MSDFLISWFVWLSDCLICGLSDSSDSLILLIVWFLWLSDSSDSSDFSKSANQQSEKQLTCYSGSQLLWPSVIQCLIQPAALIYSILVLSDLQKVRHSVHQMYQVYRRSGEVSVQMYQIYRRSITMSIQINHFYSRSVIMFVQIYRRSVITFVRYTVSDFQLQQKFSKVVGFLMRQITRWCVCCVIPCFSYVLVSVEHLFDLWLAVEIRLVTWFGKFCCTCFNHHSLLPHHTLHAYMMTIHHSLQSSRAPPALSTFPVILAPSVIPFPCMLYCSHARCSCACYLHTTNATAVIESSLEVRTHIVP